ncbi:MAG: LytTR family DNA-binding domain-containing protein [Defluviitaleaceae bacterium]|nr:LytTR family DNA-binding domain-containing protein [Defluviitaleaceae bacterium]
MIHIAVCDDIPEHLNHTLMLLDVYQQKRPDIKLCLHNFNSGEQLISALDMGQRFDLYLLDILMPKTNGIKLAQHIRLLDKDIPLVFLTQSTDYALDAFSVYAVQYILKPVNKDALFLVLNKLLDKLTVSQKREEERFIVVSASGRIVPLAHTSIIVVEHVGRILKFHLDNGCFIESKSIRTTFELSVSELLKDSRFLWVHQSYVVNMAYVSELRDRLFIMKNGMEISIPKPKYTAMKKTYLKYLAELSKGLM